MPPASLAIELAVGQFRHLIWVALASGALAGLALFAVQQWTVIPLIEAAETYEAASGRVHSGTLPENEGWQPRGALERNAFTALATVLSGIGFAAVLFAVLAFAGKSLTAGRGALWGLAGFGCFALAPALGLPPVPPGAAVAGLHARQLWWLATVTASAAGLWLLIGQRRNGLLRVAGVISVVLPHMIGAPVASGQGLVPMSLLRQFVIASLATQAMFWLLLGTVGGFLYGRTGEAQASERPDAVSPRIAGRASADRERSDPQ